MANAIDAIIRPVGWQKDHGTNAEPTVEIGLPIRMVSTEHMVLDTVSDNRQVRINSRSFVQATGDSIGFQSKPSQGATTTGEVYGGQVSPRVASTFGAGSLIGMSVDPVIQGSTGTITALRGLQVTMTDNTPSPATRTITRATMIRLWHQMEAHTFTNGVIGIDWEAAGGRAWTFAMRFADDSGTGLADLASATATVNGVIKVQIGSTTGYIATYASYTPS